MPGGSENLAGRRGGRVKRCLKSRGTDRAGSAGIQIAPAGTGYSDSTWSLKRPAKKICRCEIALEVEIRDGLRGRNKRWDVGRRIKKRVEVRDVVGVETRDRIGGRNKREP